jgi:hypothetical protein
MALAALHTRRAASGAASCSYAPDAAPSLLIRQLTSALPNPRIGQASVSGRSTSAALPGGLHHLNPFHQHRQQDLYEGFGNPLLQGNHLAAFAS